MLIMLFLIAAVSALVYFPYGRSITRRAGRQPFSFHLVKYLLIGYLLSLLYLTIFWHISAIPFPLRYHSLNLTPFIWVTEVYGMGVKKMAQQLILNVAMFVPYGLLLPLAVKKARHAWITLPIVLFSTIGIETIQYFIGRSADIDDVIMNFLGGILGYLLFAVLNRWLGDRI